MLDPATPRGSFTDLPTAPCAYLGAGGSVTGNGSRTIYTASKDNAGNAETPVVIASFKIDQTPPTLSPTVSPNLVRLNGLATATSRATDGVSGLASQSCGPLNTTPAGTKTVTCTATDKAGNSASVNTTYIVGYHVSNLFPPNKITFQRG